MGDIHPHSIQGLPEPLSQRERDVLVLLAENLSNREIAERLFLAYTTVKWYNSQIFGKLGVENRDQAVQRAFALGLLKSSRPPTPAPAHNLPAQLTPFIGREGELEDLTRLFGQSHNRLLTILAPGGMGKTRLALAAAENVLGQFENGVYFVPLAPLTSSDQVVSAIADSIGLHFSPDNRPPQRQLLDFLSVRHTLLVLDNFEHLLDGVALVADILNAAPGIKVLATSRERLNLEGETVYPLAGLPYPGQMERGKPLAFSAMQLFIQCACRANSSFVASDEASIAHVCQLVQGMPLALELAGAWVGTLSPAEIAIEIARSADFLRTTMRNAPERLRSIRAVFEATWRRLTPNERQAFRRLSIFRGGCTREAAQVVSGADLSTLAALIDKALLRRMVEGGRYEIHELLRQYAAEQLDAAGEVGMTRSAHRDYFGKLANVWGKALKTPQQLEALDVLEADFDNLREAFRHAIESGQADVIEPFADLWFYEIRARSAEGLEIFGAAIEALKGQDSIALAKLLIGQAIFHERFYRFDLERQFAEQSIAILQRLGAEREMAFSKTALGVALSSLGDDALAEAYYREALELAQRYDDQWVIAILLVCFGGIAMTEQRLDEAKRFFAQAYALGIKMGNFWAMTRILGNLGYMALDERNYAEAKRFFDEAVASALKVHHLNWLCSALNGLMMTAFAEGNFAQAGQHAEKMLAASSEIGGRHEYFMAIVGMAEIASATGNDAEARQHLREALRIIPNLDDQTFFLLLLGLAAIPLLLQLQTMTQAVLVVGFFQRHPEWVSPRSIEWEKLQIFAGQLQAQLPADTYAVAWNESQTLTLDDLLSILHAVI